MDIIIAALATWQIIEIWHHSLLMAPLRSIAEMWDNKIGDLLSCPFCLSPWVGLVCITVLSVAEVGWFFLALSAIVKAFAVARLANLGSDFFKRYDRTPKIKFD